MNQSKPTAADILITLFVGVALAVGLDAPGWSQGASGATATRVPRIKAPRTAAAVAQPRALAPVAATQTAAKAIEPQGPQTNPTLEWPLAARITERALAADRLAEEPTLGQLQSALTAGDVRSLVAWVPDGHETFAVVDLAEREPPRAAGPIAAAVLLDGLIAASSTPRVMGWFELAAAAPEGGESVRQLGVISCCWQREPDTPAAPAGWLLEFAGRGPAWSLWVWLGSAQEGATTDQLMEAWAATGAWSAFPAGPERASSEFVRVVWPGPS